VGELPSRVVQGFAKGKEDVSMKALTWLFLVLVMIQYFPLPPGAAGEKDDNVKERNMVKLTLGSNKKVVELGEKFDSFLELTNISDKPILLKWRMHQLLEFITYEGLDPDGKVTRIGGTAHLSPFEPPMLRRLVLMPGAKLTHVVKAVAYPPESLPGVYRTKAMFEYQDPEDAKAPVLRAEAVAEIELRAPKKK
jgi:hypothetical protein